MLLNYHPAFRADAAGVGGEVVTAFRGCFGFHPGNSICPECIVLGSPDNDVNFHIMACVKLFVVGVAVLLMSRMAFSEEPTTQPDLPKGRPTWVELGGDVYENNAVTDAEKLILSFDQQSYWFGDYIRPVSKEAFGAYASKHGHNIEKGSSSEGQQRYFLPDTFPYPASIAEIPAEDRGVKLTLNVTAFDPGVLHFAISLSSTQRPVWREVQHRATNVLPFLFSFFVDGTPVVCNAEFPERKSGGQRSVELIPKSGGERNWLLKVDAASARKLLPSGSRHVVTIFAAFSERQRTPFYRVDSLEPAQFFTSWA